MMLAQAQAQRTQGAGGGAGGSTNMTQINKGGDNNTYEVATSATNTQVLENHADL